MKLRPITSLITLSVLTLLISGSVVISAFNRMPPAENLLGTTGMYELDQSGEQAPQELAMLESGNQ